MVRLTDRPNMTLNVYRGRKKQQYNNNFSIYIIDANSNALMVLTSHLIGYHPKLVT